MRLLGHFDLDGAPPGRTCGPAGKETQQGHRSEREGGRDPQCLGLSHRKFHIRVVNAENPRVWLSNALTELWQAPRGWPTAKCQEKEQGPGLPGSPQGHDNPQGHSSPKLWFIQHPFPLGPGSSEVRLRAFGIILLHGFA